MSTVPHPMPEPEAPDVIITGQEILFHLPDTCYLSFVNLLMGRQPPKPQVDPFTQNLSEDEFERVCHPRAHVHAEICRLGSQVIVGRPGSGKTTLVRYLARLHSNQAVDKALPRTLAVQLPLPAVLSTVAEAELLEGRASCLSSQYLSQAIFDAFWQQIVLKRLPLPSSGLLTDSYLDILRRDRAWMERLRWFYKRCGLREYGTAADFELEAWLTAPHRPRYNSHLHDEAVLCELIAFITDPIFERHQTKWGPENVPWPYERVQVYVDGIERLSNPALERFFQDMEKLEDLTGGRVDFKVFVDREDCVERLECVQQGRVSLYRLPGWGSDELRALIARRLRGWAPDEDAGLFGDDANWAESFDRVPTVLEPSAKAAFITCITAGAACLCGHLDAPVHALRLARGLLAACARVWQQNKALAGSAPPLSAAECQGIVDAYWEAMG